MKTRVNSIREVVEVLTGRTGYDEVEYRGEVYRRSSACASQYAKNGEISKTSAKKYIEERLKDI